MADNIDITPGAGKIIAADEIAGVLHQRVKLTLGNDGVNDGDVSATNPMPVSFIQSDTTASGTIAANGEMVTINPSGTGTVGVQITGVWVGTIEFEATTDGTNFFSVPFSGIPSGALVTNVTGNTNGRINSSAYSQVRLRASAWTSGTASISLIATASLGLLRVFQTDPGSLQSAISGNVAAGVTDSGNPVKVGGKFNTTLPTLTNGQRGDIQLDSRSIPYVVPMDSQRASYSASVFGLVSAALATDIFTITGSGSKTIKITKIRVSGTRTTSTTTDLLLIKRSTADTGGTGAAVTSVRHDSSDPAAAATVVSYTANPVLGTTVGTVRSAKQFLNTSGVGSSDVLDWSWTDRLSRPIVLRGTSEVLAVNLNGVTVTGASFNISAEWTEE